MNVVHITEIHGLKMESIAFISYVVNQYAHAPFETLAFKVVNEPFLKARATHVAVYGNEETGQKIEFWIISKDDEPMGMAIKVTKNGVHCGEDTSFINFIMRPYHQDCVVSAINSLPQVRYE